MPVSKNKRKSGKVNKGIKKNKGWKISKQKEREQANKTRKELEKLRERMQEET